MKAIDVKMIGTIASELRLDAVVCEKVEEIDLDKKFKDARRSDVKKAKDIISNKRYWSGYLDALNNLEERIKLQEGHKR